MNQKLLKLLPVHCEPYFPEDLEYGKIYFNNTPELCSVSYLCPCGCAKYVYLPCYLQGQEKKTSPRWLLTYTKDINSLTLFPSILDKGSCHSHYFIESNEVKWC
jgi:hypothetical protein